MTLSMAFIVSLKLLDRSFFLQAISQSTGDISETANEEYFQYVLQRFETELPDYEEALIQNGLKESKRPRILRFEGF